MGAKAKGRRTAAVADAPPPLQPVRQPKPPMPKMSATSDPVTGERIEPGRYDYFKRLPDVDESRPADAQEPIPTAIHSSRVEGHHESLGSRAWSYAFARYMMSVLPRIVAEERRMWLQWWEIDYVAGRIRKRLGAEMLDVTLAVLRDGASVATVATDFQHSQPWVRQCLYSVCTMAESYFRHRSRS